MTTNNKENIEREDAVYERAKNEKKIINEEKGCGEKGTMGEQQERKWLAKEKVVQRYVIGCWRPWGEMPLPAKKRSVKQQPGWGGTERRGKVRNVAGG